ncbi:unnamed protein product, partial [Iphiclides podalirius]
MRGCGVTRRERDERRTWSARSNNPRPVDDSADNKTEENHMQATTADCESQSAHPIKKKRKMESKTNTDDDNKMEMPL